MEKKLEVTCDKLLHMNYFVSPCKQRKLLHQKPQPFPLYPLTYMISCNNYYILPYHKISKISPGAYIFQRPFLSGLSTERNLCFKMDWASLIVGSKFTVFTLFYFEFEGHFPSTSPLEAYIWSNLRSGSIFVSLWKLNSGGQGERKREPDTNLLRNICRPLFWLIDIAESTNQNYFRCLFF